MEIKVFGPGCARCTEVESIVKEVAAAKGGNISIQKVTDLKEMMAAGVMSTPAVMVDGVLKSTGKIPAREEIASWIDSSSSAINTPKPQGGGCCCGGSC